MSPDMEGLVQTSLNLGQVYIQGDQIVTRFMVRSSLNSQRDEIVEKVRSLARSFGGETDVPTSSAAWEYRTESRLRDAVVQAFHNVYGTDPQIMAMHGGLECGVLAGKMPGLDCISYGPDLTDIHTPAERLHIASVQRVWALTLEILKNLK